jgi:hypothetical protein
VFVPILPSGAEILITDFVEGFRSYWDSIPQNIKVKYDIADAQALQYPDNSFDRYISISTFTTFAIPDITFKEAFRVLKSEGTIVVNMPVTCSYEQTAFYLVRAALGKPVDPNDLLGTVSDPSFLADLCEIADFTEVLVFYDVFTFD